MALFAWMKKPAVPDPIYSVMNDDHVQLYRILGELRQGAGKRSDSDASRATKRKHTLSVLSRLIQGSKDHFVREEALMEQHRYPGTAAHRSEHLMLIRSIEMFYAQLGSGTTETTEDVAQYLKAWLTNHIRTTDRQLERFLFDAHKTSNLHRSMALNPAAMTQFRALVQPARPVRPEAKAG